MMRPLSQIPGQCGRGLTPIKRIIIVLAVLFTAFHVFATFLWIAPASQLREVVPGNVLQRYMIPMFGQSWSVFAPNPINGDYRLQVRAVVDKNGKEKTTTWVDATSAELTMHMRHLFPPRAGTTAIDVASRFKGDYDSLNKDQKKVASLGYYKGSDWRARLETGLRKNAGNKQGKQIVDSYLDMERIATTYSTQVAYAMWGEGVQHVQFIVSRQNVIAFDKRNDRKAKRPAAQPAPTGWRATLEEPGQARDKFADVFLRGVNDSDQGGVSER